MSAQYKWKQKMDFCSPWKLRQFFGLSSHIEKKPECLIRDFVLLFSEGSIINLTSIIFWYLQLLLSASGRKITSSGRRDLDQVAGRITLTHWGINAGLLRMENYLRRTLGFSCLSGHKYKRPVAHLIFSFYCHIWPEFTVLVVFTMLCNCSSLIFENVLINDLPLFASTASMLACGYWNSFMHGLVMEYFYAPCNEFEHIHRHVQTS